MIMLYFKWNNVFTPYKDLLLIFGPDYISASNSIYQLFSDSQVIFAFLTTFLPKTFSLVPAYASLTERQKA